MKNINFGILITNTIKMAGLVFAVASPHGILSPHPQTVIICFCAFTMAGAEMSEKAIVGIIDRFLGRVSTEEEKKSPEEPPKTSESG